MTYKKFSMVTDKDEIVKLEKTFDYPMQSNAILD